jgi:UDP-N-acetylglucosamine 4,6-dehydratase/5-epimerase
MPGPLKPVVPIPSPELDGKSILVTGGTGSFGQQFVATVLRKFKPRRLIVYSRDEYKQYEMAQLFGDAQYPNIRYFIGDVRDRDRLEIALRGVDIVVHAAALKHVPAAEYNPFECINTNVLGAENLVQASIRCGVKRILALSTDKAASPINLYGVSKLAADKIFVAANNLSAPSGTVFSVVRYGNVIGSRGSVVPLFRKLLAQGADSLPITDARMTRFWITLEQGVEFVLSCLALMRGGEIFIPRIPSMKVVDMARALAPGLPHRVVGVRPGEKLHEVMTTRYDTVTTLDLGDRYVIEPAFASWKRRSFREDGGRPVPEDFEYSSDTNTDWLGAEDLVRLVGKS